MKNLTQTQEAQLAKAISEAVSAALNQNQTAQSEALPAVPGFVLKGDIAKMVRKTSRTVESWAARGLIPSVLIGRSRLYDPQAVRRALIEKCGVGMAPERN